MRTDRVHAYGCRSPLHNPRLIAFRLQAEIPGRAGYGCYCSRRDFNAGASREYNSRIRDRSPFGRWKQKTLGVQMCCPHTDTPVQGLQAASEIAAATRNQRANRINPSSFAAQKSN